MLAIGWKGCAAVMKVLAFGRAEPSNPAMTRRRVRKSAGRAAHVECEVKSGVSDLGGEHLADAGVDVLHVMIDFC